MVHVSLAQILSSSDDYTLKIKVNAGFFKWNCVKMKSVKADMCKVTKKTEEMDESFSETTIKSVTSQLD